MGVRLKNVDEIVTSGGQTLDVLAAVGVASGGSTNVMRITVSTVNTDYYFGFDKTYNFTFESLLGGSTSLAKAEYSVDGGGFTTFMTSGATGSFVLNESALVQESSAPANYSEQKEIVIQVTDSAGNVNKKTIINTFTYRPVGPTITCDFLIVGGGGAGGGHSSGSKGAGGGAGGMLQYSSTMTTNNTHTQTIDFPSYDYIDVTVGAGGQTGSASGQNSEISYGSFLISALGGGGGGNNVGSPAKAGGSGGGACGNDLAGEGTAGQGNDGGTGNQYQTGGGGGAGAQGGNGSGSETSGSSGAGGAGLQSDLTGTLVYYAGGGGGGQYRVNSGGNTGGTGGGGAGGAAYGGTGSAGAANTGGGGGGAGGYADQTKLYSRQGNGGSGIIVLSYPDTLPDMTEMSSGMTIEGATTVNSGTTPPSPSLARNGFKTYKILNGSGQIKW